MLEDKGQDLDHLAIAAGHLEHVLLRGPECRRQFGEGRPIAQGAGLALDNREIVPPVVNRRAAHQLVGTGEDASVLAHDLPFVTAVDKIPHGSGRVVRLCRCKSPSV